jgi:hypothetical protein
MLSFVPRPYQRHFSEDDALTTVSLTPTIEPHLSACREAEAPVLP